MPFTRKLDIRITDNRTKITYSKEVVLSNDQVNFKDDAILKDIMIRVDEILTTLDKKMKGFDHDNLHIG